MNYHDSAELGNVAETILQNNEKCFKVWQFNITNVTIENF